jgi:carbamoyl-phosphate synthase large subunit
MKSTGEVMGCDYSLGKALYKAMLAVYGQVPLSGNLLASLAEKDKAVALPLLKDYVNLGYRLYASGETARFLKKEGLEVTVVDLAPDRLANLIRKGQIQLVINTPTKGHAPDRLGFQIRRTAVEYRTPCFTSLDTAKAFRDVLIFIKNQQYMEARTLQDLRNYAEAHQKIAYVG